MGLVMAKKSKKQSGQVSNVQILPPVAGSNGVITNPVSANPAVPANPPAVNAVKVVEAETPQDKTELLGMVGDRSDVAIADENGLFVEHDVDAVPPPEHVFEMLAWDEHKGRDLCESDQFFRNRKVAYKKEDGTDAQIAFSKAVENQAALAADLFHAAFQPEPLFHEKCADTARQSFIRDMFETPAFLALRAQTQLDEEASELAALSFGMQYAAMMVQAKGKQGQGDQDGNGSGAGAGGSGSSMQNMKAISNALNQAKEGVEKLQGMREVFKDFCSSEKLADLFKRVKKNEKLKKIAEVSGRYLRCARGKQRTKVSHGADDVIGIEVGRDLARIVASELVNLADEDLESDVLRRIVEGQLICRSLRTNEPIGRGPIMVFVDESGSMAGAREENAKALCLALAWIAKHQKRWICLVGFSGYADPDSLRAYVADPSQVDDAALLDWLMAFQGGGTTFNWISAETMDAMFARTSAKRGQTDVILISDGECGVADEMVKSFAKWKVANKAKMQSILIGHGGEQMMKFSDTFFSVPAIDVSAEAVGQVLSI